LSKPNKAGASHAGNVIRLTLTGLTVFTLLVITVTALLTYKLARLQPPAWVAHPMDEVNGATLHTGAWGTLLARNIELEGPEEFLTGDMGNPAPELWTFTGLKLDGVKELLGKNGLTHAQIEDLLMATNLNETETATVVQPSSAFLLSLKAETRRQLYTALAGMGVNLFLDFPYIFPEETVQSVYQDKVVYPDDVALLKKLVYPNGSAHQLSDYQFLLKQIPTKERRVAITRALSRQTAVLARLMVRPDTDIDKISAYWGHMPNVRFTDIRPLFESLKQLPEGGGISLVYLLPKFARDRLYTFPQQPEAGEQVMDCHWSTFNFFNETPDNRLADPPYAGEYIRKNYYQISSPSLYGDVLLLMNEKQEVKHSAVYIADDLVFTKNGNNYCQPWMLMRIPNLVAAYPNVPPMKVVYLRRKVD